MFTPDWPVECRPTKYSGGESRSQRSFGPTEKNWMERRANQNTGMAMPM